VGGGGRVVGVGLRLRGIELTSFSTELCQISNAETQRRRGAGTVHE
jgi:hypothetical protein